MKKTVLIGILMTLFFACKSSEVKSADFQEQSEPIVVEAMAPKIVLGAERMNKYIPMLENRRVAMVVNQTSTIGSSHLVDTFQSVGVNVVKVFAPEHGFRGNHSAGAVIQSGVDVKTGLPVVSLYGKNKKPTAAMLQDIDVVVFDIQDVGVRFYTYISTMHYVMEACAELGKEVIILDRPNPNGFYVDGPVLEIEYKSFIGMHPIPIVHGLTVGELAGMINGELWLKNEVVCKVTVIPCQHYSHELLYELPIKPSPNLPNMNSVYLYPYLGLFEGTNVSIGRGTELPFQVVGRPGVEGAFSFTPRGIPGVSENPKYKDKKCGGEVVLDVSNGSLLSSPTLNLIYLLKYHDLNKSEDGPYFKDFFYKLTGSHIFRELVEQGESEDKIRLSWEPALGKYKQMRKKYLLYP